MGRKKNPRLKPANQETEFTPQQVLELKRCMADPVYFARKYVKIQHPTKGAIPFELYDYQIEMMKAFQQNRYNIILSARQTGKSITSAVYLLWFAIFNFDKKILIASNKNKGAMEMIHRIRYAYENLPMWLKPGVTEDGWNKHSVAFDNDSRIDSTATSEDSGRGESISLLFLDEFAFVKPNIQDEFWTSILPTLSTGGACIMSSTPNGDSDLFATLWRAAQVGKGMEFEDEEGHKESLTFTPKHVPWDAPPGRDEKFKMQQIAMIGELKWKQEYECEFLSSDALLISSVVLGNMTPRVKQVTTMYDIRGVEFFEDIKSDGTYLVGVDPSTGSGSDFSVIEVYEFPSLKQIAEYRSNSMSSSHLYIILKAVLRHLEQDNATVYFSVENNGVGEGIIALYESDEAPPPESIFISEEGKERLGMTTTKKVKMRACLNLKDLLEKNKMEVNSVVLLNELKSYVRKRGSYAAQYGSTDDAVSATLIVMRLLQEIAAFEQDAYDKLYSLNEEEYDENSEDGDDAPMPMVF